MSAPCPTCSTHFAATGAEEPRDFNGHVDPRTLAIHQKLLISNVAPASAELPFIRAVVSKTSGRLGYLESEIARLRHQLTELEEEHTLLSSYRAQNLGILSPLRRMPPEVLGEIFSWTLPSAREALDRGWFDIGSSPWVLTHVSRRWRTVAISNPSLWSLVCVEYQISSQYPLPLLEAQISRARNLKVHFHGHESEPHSQIALFKFLVEHSSAWEEFSILLTTDLWPLLSTIRHRIPALRRLCIQWAESYSPASVESIDAFQNAPSLLDLTVNNEYRHVPILFPAHHLTRYQFDGPWATHESILRSAPNLVEARIIIAFDYEPWPEQGPEQGDIITLPRLQRLAVSDSEILRYLRTPNLQEITLPLFENEDYALNFEPFVVRSACNLRRIGFRGAPETHQITAILQKYPSITELGIMVHRNSPGLCEETNNLISQLITPNLTRDTELSAQLSTIVLRCKDTSYIDQALYLRMLETRWRAPGYALKSAALFTDQGTSLHPATLEGFSTLRTDGLDLLLVQGPKVDDVSEDWVYSARWL